MLNAMHVGSGSSRLGPLYWDWHCGVRVPKYTKSRGGEGFVRSPLHLELRGTCASAYEL